MFRPMRRYKQELTKEEAETILNRHTSGTLALSGDDGYPYSVPISYVYDHGVLYFHCASSGHKIDAIHNSNKASFSVIDQDVIVPQRYTTHYKSVISFGRITILCDAKEKEQALRAIGTKYGTGDAQDLEQEVQKTLPVVCILKMDIEHMTGKQAKELAMPQ
jgi:nitroimidazol reductase NimA-like FMN-containing flavoprotein (pyridoxamine 5'-phosphate oxidase superfamily)